MCRNDFNQTLQPVKSFHEDSCDKNSHLSFPLVARASQPSTSGINLIKILLQTQWVVLLPVLVSICLIYDPIGEDPALLPKQSGHYHKMCHNPTPIYLFG